MDSKIEQVLVSATSAAIAWLIDKAKHHDTKVDARELEAAAIAAAQAAVQRAALELELRGFQLSTEVLAAAAAQLLEALHNPPPSSLPNLLGGAQVEQMPPGWEAPEEVPLSPVLDSDDIPTKPGGE